MDPNKFRPRCENEATPSLLDRSIIDKPMKIGGPCLGNRTHSKECGRECLRKDQPCDGKCAWDQCMQGDKCLQMYAGSTHKSRILRRICGGQCVPHDKPCDGKCEPEFQCYHKASNKCLQPRFPEKDSARYKSCDTRCILESELCHGSCGDIKSFCWDEKARICKSVTEEKQDGTKVRRTCNGKCIPSSQQCEGRCAPDQCKQGNQCLEELQTT